MENLAPFASAFKKNEQSFTAIEINSVCRICLDEDPFELISPCSC
jgi:hypothetical protein